MSERRLRDGLALGLLVLVLAAYVETMAGSVSCWDCGEFIAAAWILGIPHPPATPLYVVLANVFAHLPLPLSIAGKVNFMSALFGALGIVVIFLIIADLVRDRRGTPRTVLDRVVVYGSAAVGALFTAWSNTYWNNAVEAEVYALGVFVMGLTVILARRWARAPESPDATRNIYLVVYLLALGIGFHLGTVLTYPAIALYLLLARNKSFEDADLVLFSFGFCLALSHLTLKVPAGTPAAILALVFLAGVLVRLRAGKRFAPVATGLVLLGISIHLFLAIRSARQPAIDEADPESWRNLMAVLRREQYPASNIFVRKASWHFQIIDHFWRYFRQQYELVASRGTGRHLAYLPMLLGVAGMGSLWRSSRRDFVLVFVTFLVCSLGLVVFLNFSTTEVREGDYFFAPAFYFFGVFIGVGLAALLDRLVLRPQPTPSLLGRVGCPAIVGVFLVLTCMQYGRWHFEHDRTRERVCWGFGYNLLVGLDANAILFTNGDNDTYPLWYQQEVEHHRADVRVVNLSMLNTPWYIHQLKEHEPKVTIDWTDVQIDNLRGEIQGDRVSLPSDLAVRRILRDNFGARPIYFSVTIPRQTFADYEDYLVLEGLVYRMTNRKGKDQKDYDKIEHNATAVYRYDGVLGRDGKRDDSVYRDANQRSLVHNYADAYTRLAEHAEGQGDAMKPGADPGGTAEERRQLYERGVRWYRRAIELSPDLEPVAAQLGNLYLKMGEVTEGVRVYEDLMRHSSSPDRWRAELAKRIPAPDKSGAARR